MRKGGRISRQRRVTNDAGAAEGIRSEFGEGAEQCTRGRVRSPDEYLVRVGVKAMPGPSP